MSSRGTSPRGSASPPKARQPWVEGSSSHPVSARSSSPSRGDGPPGGNARRRGTVDDDNGSTRRAGSSRGGSRDASPAARAATPTTFEPSVYVASSSPGRAARRDDAPSAAEVVAAAAVADGSAFNLKKAGASGRAAAKDGAILALSKQLDAMRARLTEEAARAQAAIEGASASEKLRAEAEATMNEMNANAPPASPPGATPTPAAPLRGGDSPMSAQGGVNGHRDSSSRGALYQRERGQYVAILRLEDENKALRARLEEAERREKEARTQVDVAATNARNEALADNFAERRTLNNVVVRSLERSAVKFAEGRLRAALAALRIYARKRRASRSLQSRAGPKWKKIQTRAAFTQFTNTIRWVWRVRTACDRVGVMTRSRRSRAAFLGWASETRRAYANARKAARKASDLYRKRDRFAVAATFGAWRVVASEKARVERKLARMKRAHEMHRRAIAWREWRREFTAARRRLAHDLAALRVRARKSRDRWMFRRWKEHVWRARVFAKMGAGKLSRAHRRRYLEVFRSWAADARATARLRRRVGGFVKATIKTHLRREMRAWRDIAGGWRVMKVAVARMRAMQKKRRVARAFDAWATDARASAAARRSATLAAVVRWRAAASQSAKYRALLRRGERNAALRCAQNAMREWRYAAARSAARAAVERASDATEAMTTLRAEADALRRASDVSEEAARKASSREAETRALLEAAEARASVLAPGGGGVLESPLTWRELIGTGAEDVAGDAAASDLECDALAPVFLPYRDGDGDVEPAARGCVVTILPGGDGTTTTATAMKGGDAKKRRKKKDAAATDEDAAPRMAVTCVEIDDAGGADASWDYEPKLAWAAIAPVGDAPVSVQNPAICALSATAAATAAAAGGADPADVVGGVFVYGGFDPRLKAETSEACALIRRKRFRRTAAKQRGGSGDDLSDVSDEEDPRDDEFAPPEWEWVRLPRALFSPPPPPRSHAVAFASAPEPGTMPDVFVHGGYQSGVGLVNDLWRFDVASLRWCSPEQYGDVPCPRRDAACATAPGARGRTFVHGGVAADGATLGDAYAFDATTCAWTRLPPDAVAASEEEARDDASPISRFGVAAEISVLASPPAPPSPFPTPRAKHALTVVGNLLLACGGVGVDGGAVSDAVVYALELDALTWRRLRVGAAAPSESPPGAAHRVTHAMFPHRAGVMLVSGGGATICDDVIPPDNATRRRRGEPRAYLVELAAAKEGRRLRATVSAAVAARASAEDDANRARAAKMSALDETQLVRAAACVLKEEADAVARSEALGREAQRVLRDKLARAREDARLADDAAARAEAEAEAAHDAASLARMAVAESKRAAAETREAAEAQLARAKALSDRRAAYATELEERVRREEERVSEARDETRAYAIKAAKWEKAAAVAESRALAADEATSAMERALKKAREAVFYDADGDPRLEKAEAVNLDLNARLARATEAAEQAKRAQHLAETHAKEALDKLMDAERAAVRAEERALQAEAARLDAAADAETRAAAMREEIAELEKEVARATEVRWGEDIDYVANVGDDVVNDEGLPDRLTSIVNAGLKY